MSDEKFRHVGPLCAACDPKPGKRVHADSGQTVGHTVSILCLDTDLLMAYQMHASSINKYPIWLPNEPCEVDLFSQLARIAPKKKKNVLGNVVEIADLASELLYD